jgi:hypothetical protein
VKFSNSNYLKLCVFLGVCGRKIEVFVLLGCSAASLGDGSRGATSQENEDLRLQSRFTKK